MKKLLIYAMFFSCTSLPAIALEDSTKVSFTWPVKKPNFFVKINGVDKKKTKGLLVSINDSSIVLFPGKLSDWKHKENFQPLQIADTSIDVVKFKKRNSVAYSAAGGAILGAFPLYTAANGDDYGARIFASLFTIPLGAAIGAITGAAFGDKYEIKGQHEAFQELKNKFNPGQ